MQPHLLHHLRQRDVNLPLQENLLWPRRAFLGVSALQTWGNCKGHARHISGAVLRYPAKQAL